MGTHDLRFLRNFFCKSSCFFGINIINDDIISGVFSPFQPCNGSMWLRGSDNKPIQKLKIFSVVFTNFDSCISECFNLNTRIVVNDRSSLQS